jgi:hypothetical protein
VRWFFRVRENQAAKPPGELTGAMALQAHKEGVDFGYTGTRCFATLPSSLITGVLGERAWSSDP